MAEDTAPVIPVYSTSTSARPSDTLPAKYAAAGAIVTGEDAEQTIANNDHPTSSNRDKSDEEEDACCSDVHSSDSHGDLGSDVAVWLGMVDSLKGMLESSLSAAVPERLLDASMVLSYSISTEIHARLPLLDFPSPPTHRPKSVDSEVSSKSSETWVPPPVRRVAFAGAAEHPRDDSKSTLDDFIRSCEEQRLHVAHKAFPGRGQVVKSGEPPAGQDVIAFWDNVGPAFESTKAPLLPHRFPRRIVDRVDRLEKIPSLIRITSHPLLELLDGIMKIDLNKTHDGVIETPFEPLVYHSSHIHARIKQLRLSANAVERELRMHDGTASAHTGSSRKPDPSAATVEDMEKQGSVSAKSNPMNIRGAPPPLAFSETPKDRGDRVKYEYRELSDELKAKVHLCLLLEGLADLITVIAEPSLEVKQKIEDGTLEVITFEELWQLFTPGETLVYHKEGHDVACQVYNVNGGMRTDNPRTERLSDVFWAPEDIASHTTAKDSRPRDHGIPVYPGHLIQQLSSQPQTAPPAAEEQGVYPTHSSFAPLTIDCFMMDFNGTHVGPCHIHFQFDYFPGERPVCSLDVYPLRFRSDKDELAARLRDRGRRVVSAAGHWTHAGMPLSGFDNIDGQIYVDNAAGYRHIGWPKERLAFGRLIWHELGYLPNWGLIKHTCHSHRYPGAHDIQNLKSTLLRFVRPATTTLSDDCYLLMPYVVLGYAFQQRRWYYFDIDCIGAIDKSEAARLSGWKDLIIPPKFREMLVALVDSHASGVGRSGPRRKGPGLVNQVDLVRGKGNGLIILLHGPPGTGKTSTAETIAAYTKRPLYSITCGDIGTTAEEVEFNLQKHFDLANQWGCVLCLDEADVFLTKRDWHDLNRNSLVSVWLRVLEYYSGILFITTNRIGVIDEAFKSRIHMCLRYPSINLDSTKSIWTKILDRIEAENRIEPVKIEFDRDAVMGFAEKHYQRNEATGSTWNGRQIRNAVQTAISLGQYERLQRLRRKDMTEEDAERSGKPKYMRVELSRENLRRIAATATDFEHYITNVRGADASVARNENVRDDDYDGIGKRPQKNYASLEDGRVGAVPGVGIGFGAGTLLSGSSSGGWAASEGWGGVSEASYGVPGKGKKKSAVVDDSDSSS